MRKSIKILDCAKEDKAEEIIVSETGALTQNQDVFGDAQSIYVQKFCLQEIEKLYSDTDKTEIISKTKADKRIHWLEEPYFKIKLPAIDRRFKRRSIGIVRLACDLASCGYKVKVITTSIEVQNLIVYQKNQNISILKY